MITYTGVGSRKTPIVICEWMTQIASWLAQRDMILRSGGAQGADLAFEKGCDLVGGSKQIFLPVTGVPREAFDIASKIHPNWNACDNYARMCHARNVQQVLGDDLHSPSQFVICWTQDGKATGGTRTAIMLAVKNNIRLYNIGRQKDLDDFYREVVNK
jgi:hypothetical protein